MAEHAYVLDEDLVEHEITINYFTKSGAFRYTHWHPFIEILFILNGNAKVILEGIDHKLVAGDFIVIDSNQLHESQCTRSSMGVSIHLAEGFFRNHLGGERNFRIVCSRRTLQREQLATYLEVCNRLKELIPVYLKEPLGYRMEMESIVMDIMYRLLNTFAVPFEPGELPALTASQSRIQEILSYIDEHYAEPIPLEEIAGHFGLSREYFSRRFRQLVGMTFSEHVSRVRLAHIYDDLRVTDEPVMGLIEKHGFTGYKHFSRLFKEIYGCTPRELRSRLSEQNVYA